MNFLRHRITLLLKLLFMSSINILISAQETHHYDSTYKTIKIGIDRNIAEEKRWSTSTINGATKCPSSSLTFTNGKQNLCVKSGKPFCLLTSPTYFLNFEGKTMTLVTYYKKKNISDEMDVELKIYWTDVDNNNSSVSRDASNNNTIDIGTTIKSMRFELKFTRFCGSFTSIKVEKGLGCVPKDKNSVIFPKIGDQQTVNGSCIENAIFSPIERIPYFTCMKNGTYVVYYGDGCKCKKGFERDNKNHCVACKQGFFKDKVGDTNCRKCGKNSRSDSSSACECEKGFLRAPGEKSISTKDCFAVPSKPSNITVVSKSYDSVTLNWNDNNPTEKGNFLIQCGNCPQKLYKTERKSITINNLKPFTNYFITISNANNPSKVNEKVSFTFKTSKSLTKETENKFKWITIAGGIVGGLVVVIIILVIVIVYKRQFPDQFEVSRMEDGTMKTERRKLFSTSRIYVDPTTYSQVDDAVQEFTLEIDRKYVTTDHLLGGGEFANVFKGILSTQSRNTDVAIKIMKPGASKADRDDFLSEAAILGQFSDPNVITIEGVILKDQPNMIVLEYMENGSLDKYLVKNDSQLSIQKLLVMARGVASGMRYLADLGYIHRDLAARNILVSVEGVCKIADFGMSRELKTDDAYDTKGGKIPIKWTAPEAIQYKKFTTASDVWSYGILLWEIFSFGERPYWEWNNLEVIERLSTGYRLPPPMECPKVIHDLMLQCWHKDRMKRPRFNVIFDKLEDWLKKPELLTEIASVITRRDEDLDYSVMEDLSSWLEAIKMDQYLKMFTESGYMTPKDVLYLTNEDLESLGVGILGHRKKLLKAIRNTRLQVEDGRRTRSSSGSTTNSRVSRSISFGSSLTKKVSFLASPNASISFKRTLTKRSSLQGYKLT